MASRLKKKAEPLTEEIVANTFLYLGGLQTRLVRLNPNKIEECFFVHEYEIAAMNYFLSLGFLSLLALNISISLWFEYDTF